jgi:hypothetical protein
MRARRGDIEDGYLVVQEMVLFLRDAFDKFQVKFQAGQATVAQSNTSIAVSLPSNPGAIYSVALTPTVDPGGRYWVTGKSSTGFTINLQTAAPVGGVSFDWSVKGA